MPSYNAPPIVIDGDTINGVWLSTYIRDNWRTLWQFTTLGDIIYATAANMVARLGIGTENQVLHVHSGIPAWRNIADAILPAVYPVGCLYTETSGVNPGTTFGFGTWVAFGQGRVLVGAGTSDATYAAGATGGESQHVLNINEIPSHSHSTPSHTHGIPARNNTAQVASGSFASAWNGTGTGSTDPGGSGGTGGAGSDGAHNNMPPYIVVYMWRRTG